MRRYRSPARSTRASQRPKRVHAQLVQAEALLRDGAGDDEIAGVLQTIDPSTLEHASQMVRAGRCWLALCDLDRAAAYFEDALALGPSPDALHGLGSVAFELGDREKAVSTWVDVRRQDLQADVPSWSLAEDELADVVERAFTVLPELIAERLSNVPILHEDYPSESLVRDGWDPRILGFFAASESLTHIVLFQRNIERFCASRAEAYEEVRITLLHETAHFFGMTDEELDEIGLG